MISRPGVSSSVLRYQNTADGSSCLASPIRAQSVASEAAMLAQEPHILTLVTYGQVRVISPDDTVAKSKPSIS